MSYAYEVWQWHDILESRCRPIVPNFKLIRTAHWSSSKFLVFYQWLPGQSMRETTFDFRSNPMMMYSTTSDVLLSSYMRASVKLTAKEREKLLYFCVQPEFLSRFVSSLLPPVNNLLWSHYESLLRLFLGLFSLSSRSLLRRVEWIWTRCACDRVTYDSYVRSGSLIYGRKSFLFHIQSTNTCVDARRSAGNRSICVTRREKQRNATISVYSSLRGSHRRRILLPMARASTFLFVFRVTRRTTFVMTPHESN